MPTLYQVMQLIALIDGAKWIAAQVTLAFLTLRVLLLDFHHRAQHVHAAAVCCLGDTDAAKQWARERLQEMKTVGVSATLASVARMALPRVRPLAMFTSSEGAEWLPRCHSFPWYSGLAL